MKKETLSPASPKTADAAESAHLTAEEAGRELATLMGSAKELNKLELYIRLYVMKVKKGSYEELEKDLISEAVARILSGRRQWPRGLNALTMLAQTAKSILHDMRNGADALAYGRRNSPPAQSFDGTEVEGDWLEQQDSKAALKRSADLISAQDALEEIWKAFNDDPIAIEVLVAKHQCGYSPKEIQELCDLTQTEYDSKWTKIRRRLKMLAVH